MSELSSSTNSDGRGTALALATIGFALNFWAWSLVSPLGPVFVRNGLAADASLMVAIPVLVGSLGRIISGALTDRFGGRRVMPIISIITIFPVLFIGLIGQNSFATLIAGGFVLGIGGTAFAVGVPYVNSWFPKKSRGSAIGIYGMGMGGTAIAAFTTVPLFNVFPALPFIIAACALAVFAALAFILMKDPPGWQPSANKLGKQLADTAKVKLTWQACYLYALSFGGYVAFSVYLPTYLSNAYGLEAADASLRMAGFVIAAVVMRPIGGLFSDKFGAVRTLVASYIVVIVCAVLLLFDPPLMPVATIGFIVMAAGLGMGSGGVFALIGQRSDPSRVGSITGFVGAAGGLGGFVPPLLLGAVWAAQHQYILGVALLAIATLVALAITIWIARTTRRATSDGAQATTHPAQHEGQ